MADLPLGFFVTRQCTMARNARNCDFNKPVIETPKSVDGNTDVTANLLASSPRRPRRKNLRIRCFAFKNRFLRTSLGQSFPAEKSTPRLRACFPNARAQGHCFEAVGVKPRPRFVKTAVLAADTGRPSPAKAEIMCMVEALDSSRARCLRP